MTGCEREGSGALRQKDMKRARPTAEAVRKPKRKAARIMPMSAPLQCEGHPMPNQLVEAPWESKLTI